MQIQLRHPVRSWQLQNYPSSLMKMNSLSFCFVKWPFSLRRRTSSVLSTVFWNFMHLSILSHEVTHCSSLWQLEKSSSSKWRANLLRKNRQIIHHLSNGFLITFALSCLVVSGSTAKTWFERHMHVDCCKPGPKHTTVTKEGWAKQLVTVKTVYSEWLPLHSSAVNRESCDWLHMTSKGDDNLTYEQPAKRSIYLAIY